MSLFQSFTVRKSQGSQFIPNPRTAQPAGFRGIPVLNATACVPQCDACAGVCPSQAIALEPLQLDLGKCVLCGDCAEVCPSHKISFSNQTQLATTERAHLLLTAEHPSPDPVKVSAALKQRFGRSMKLRSVSAGGCNGCELEVNASSNVNFDLGRYGIDVVASPRHADALVLTGPITRNMAQALELCWLAMPEPKIVIAVGACAISGGVFAGSDALDRSFLERFKPSLYVPGCPAHPLTLVCGILDLLGIAS